MQRFSLIDYPGKVSAIIFTQGCNFRCPYCYNPELVDPKLFKEPIPEEKIFSFLEARKGKLDGVVVTGGEPTIQEDLTRFVEKVKEMGYLVKLDTNGSNPDVLEELLDNKLVDYIAMDVKAPPQKYGLLTQVNTPMKRIERSVSLIMSSNIGYEFRTTVIKTLLTEKDVIEIAKFLSGAKLFVIQKFVQTEKILDKKVFEMEMYDKETLQKLRKEAEKHVQKCLVR